MIKKFIFWLMLVLFVVFWGSYCGNSNIKEISNNISNDYKIESRNMLFDNESFIVKYPKILSESKVVDKTNKQIEILLSTYLKTSLSDIENSTAHIDFEVHCLDGEYISISFEGYYNCIKAAHPINFCYTINLNIKNGSAVKLTDNVVVNEDFIKKFRNGWETQVLVEAQNYLDQYTDEQLKTMLMSSDTDKGYGVFSCFTENEKIIYFPVAHAIGDYAVIKVKS